MNLPAPYPVLVAALLLLSSTMTSAAQPAPAPECNAPAPAQDELALTVGAYEGQNVSSTYVGTPDAETSIAVVEVQPGDQKIHLTIAGFSPMIWRLEGATDRISTVVVGGMAPGGVTGIDPAKVVPLPGRCVQPHYEIASGSPLVRGTYTLERMIIPSMDLLGRDDYRKVDPVLIEIEANEVISHAVVGEYDVLPGRIGLEALVAAGAIQAIPLHDRSGRPPSSTDWMNTVYRIVGDVLRLPPELRGMRYSLPPGVDIPPGADSSSCFNIEAGGPPRIWQDGRMADADEFCINSNVYTAAALERELGIAAPDR